MAETVTPDWRIRLEALRLAVACYKGSMAFSLTIAKLVEVADAFYKFLKGDKP